MVARKKILDDVASGVSESELLQNGIVKVHVSAGSVHVKHEGETLRTMQAGQGADSQRWFNLGQGEYITLEADATPTTVWINER